MRHSQLSNEQILLALSESYNISAAITKYQVFLASAIGLPKDDTGRVPSRPKQQRAPYAARSPAMTAATVGVRFIRYSPPGYHAM